LEFNGINNNRGHDENYLNLYIKEESLNNLIDMDLYINYNSRIWRKL